MAPENHAGMSMSLRTRPRLSIMILLYLSTAIASLLTRLRVDLARLVQALDRALGAARVRRVRAGQRRNQVRLPVLQ